MDKAALFKKLVGFLWEALKMAVMLCIFGGIGIFIAVGSRAGSAERFAEQYFSYYVSNNYAKMYEMIDKTESGFINYDNFANMCASRKAYGNLENYHIGEAVDHGTYRTYVVNYSMYDDHTSYAYTITLKRQDTKVYGFFHTWKVSVKRFLVNDFEIHTPINSEAMLDGKNLAGYLVGTTEDGSYDVYKIPTLFVGDHTVSVYREELGNRTQSFYVGENRQLMEIAPEEMVLDRTTYEDLKGFSGLLLMEMYAKVMDPNTTFEDTMSRYFSTSEEAQTIGKAVFDSLRLGVAREDGTILSAIDFGTIKGTLLSYQHPNKVVLKLDYTYNFEAGRGGNLMNGLTSRYQGKGASTAIFTFRKMDGKWKLEALTMPCISFERV